MKRGDVCDAHCQRFFKEVVNNENRVRMKWFVNNRERLVRILEDEDAGWEEKFRKFKNECQPWTPKPKADLKEVVPVAASIKADDAVNLCYMRPVPPPLIDIFYDKDTVSHDARKKYLKERHKTRPEDRFILPECTSWLYGWKIGEFQSFPPKVFNRKPIVRTTFYRNNLSSIKRDDQVVRKSQATASENYKDVLDYWNKSIEKNN